MRETGHEGCASDAAIRNARRALGIVFFVNGAIFASWAARLPAVVGGLELTPGALGLALLCQAAGTPVAMPVCGAAVARFGSRPAARAALLASCLALPLTALAANVWVLSATLALLGASIGSLVVAQNAQGIAVEKAFERPVLNGLHGLLSLGWLAGSLIGAGAAGAGFSPLSHFFAMSSLLLGVGLLASRWMLPERSKGEATGPAAFARPSEGLLVLAAISFCCLLAEGAALDWGAVHLGETLGAGEALAALGPAAFAAAMTAGRLLGDRPAARLSVSALIRGAGSLGALGMLLTAAAERPWLGVAGLGLLGAGLSVIFPILLGVAGGGEGPPGPRIAAVATAGYVGLLAGPALIGAVAELSSLRVGLAVAALFVGLVPLLASRIGRNEVPTGPDDG